MELIKNNILSISGILLGAVAGYLYYTYFGCTSGTCAITSKPLYSMIYGAVLGKLILDIFKKEPINQE